MGKTREGIKKRVQLAQDCKTARLAGTETAGEADEVADGIRG